MNLKPLLKAGAAALAMIAFGTTSASGQACEITELSSASGELYLEAQNQLVVNDDPRAALVAINKLRSKPLNCYEEDAILGLSAQAKLNTGDTLGAIQDLRTQIEKNYTPAENRPGVMKIIWQLYFQENKFREGIDFSKRWLAAGGNPTRDEMWSFVAVYSNLKDYSAAIPWAEKVYARDGNNAPEAVTQSLIFFYDETRQPAKKAALIEKLLEQNPSKRLYWDAISGDYSRAGDDNKAFEVQKAMYLGGILKTEAEIERIVQYYNLLDAPYQAARILEKEMNAGRITKNYDNLELLANLYQVAREPEKAIPVIQQAAAINNNGAMYERLGRSYADLQKWEESEQALTRALNAGGLKDAGLAWVQIGQSRYQRGDRAGARDAFRKANNRGGRGWLGFMNSEEETEKALKVFEARNKAQEFENEKKACDRLKVLGDNLPDGCATVADRLSDALAEVERIRAS